MKLLVFFMAVWNLITFGMMGADKARAKADRRRISEKTLLLSGFLMGAAGIAAGALIFHHKTRKLKFQILVPLSIIVNIAILYTFLSYNGVQ